MNRVNSKTKKKNWSTTVLTGALFTALIAPLVIAGAGASLDNGGFMIKATDVGDPEIFAINGMKIAQPGDGGGTVDPPEENIMRSTWDTSLTETFQGIGSGCSTITLPFKGETLVDIDWGDGNLTTDVTGEASHSFDDSGPNLKSVTVTGSFSGYGVTETTLGSQTNHCLVSVDKWDSGTGTEDLSYAFALATNLEKVNAVPSTVKNLSYALIYASNFNGAVDGWNTSNVTDMSFMFGFAEKFNKPLDGWVTSNVNNMSFMFAGAADFNQALGSWNTTKVSNMSWMFNDASSFNQELNFATSSALQMQGMFAGASSFNKELSWDTSRVENMHRMFDGATLMSHDISDWNVNNVTIWNSFFTSSGLLSSNVPSKFR